MQTANNSKSNHSISELDINACETELLLRMRTLGMRNVARSLGWHESKISRFNFRDLASVLVATGHAWDVSILKEVAKLALYEAGKEIRKKKSPAAMPGAFSTTNDQMCEKQLQLL